MRCATPTPPTIAVKNTGKAASTSKPNRKKAQTEAPAVKTPMLPSPTGTHRTLKNWVKAMASTPKARIKAISAISAQSGRNGAVPFNKVSNNAA